MAKNDVKPEAAAPAEQQAPVTIDLPVETPVPAVLAATPSTAAKVKPVAPAAKPAAQKPATPAKAPAPAVAPVAKQLAAPQPAAIPAAKEMTMDNQTETVTNKAQAMFAEGNDRAKAAMQKGQQLFTDANDFTKGNVEAIIESSKIAAKGAEEIARYSTDYARQTVAKANDNARRLASVKSPTEFFQLQTEIARGTVDAFASEGAKFAENYLKLVGEIVQPLSNRFAVAADKLKVAA